MVNTSVSAAARVCEEQAWLRLEIMEVELPLAETSVCPVACRSVVEPTGRSSGCWCTCFSNASVLLDGGQVALVKRVSFLLLPGYQIQELHCHLWIVRHFVTDGHYRSVRLLGNLRLTISGIDGTLPDPPLGVLSSK